MLHISQYFLTHHGEQIAREIGLDPGAIQLDPEVLRGALGLPADGSLATHRDIRQQRRQVREKLDQARRRR
jgi:hypothetical protein